MSRSVPTATQPKMVLQSYLDDLLHEATGDSSCEEAIALTPEPMPARAESEPVAPVRLLELDSPTLPRFELPLPKLPEEPLLPPSPVINPVTELPQKLPQPLVLTPEPTDLNLEKPSVAASPQVVHEQIPHWADGPFECLLFNVAGLTLAVPLVSLGSIYPLNEHELTPLFGQPDWFLGILSTPSGNLKVLETVRWLIPDRYQEEFKENLKYAISVQGYDWAMAVHQVNRSIRLRPDEVKWRTQRTQRPWLAGTVIEHMCALLDISALAELIASGATRHKNFLAGA